MSEQSKGKFVVVDGIDGVGKGAFLDTFVGCAKQDGKRVFDVNEFWKSNDYNPDLSSVVGKYDLLLTSEPTFMGVGRLIRDEFTAKNGRMYSPQAVMEAFALDRRILYEQLVLSVLAEGIDVYQSRSFSTSIVYQLQMVLDNHNNDNDNDNIGKVNDVIKSILAIPGNAFCYQHPMDFLVVPTITNVNEAVRRAQSREKQDNSVFENLEFQLKIKKHYESREFQNVFEWVGVPITYMDAGKSLEFSQEQAREFYFKQLR